MMETNSNLLPGPFRSRWAGKRGSILILVIWVLSILGPFAISIGYHVRQKITLSDRLNQRGWLSGLAQAGISQGVQEVLRDENEDYDSLLESWANNESVFYQIGSELATWTVFYDYYDDSEQAWKERYGVQDEGSKLNLNIQSAPIMARLFQIVAEVDQEAADEIAYSIVDWRDSDTFLKNPTYGGESDYYEDLDIPYSAKDGPLEVLDELLLIRGMTPEIYSKIKDFVTVFGESGVNINTASRPVLLALGLGETTVQKIFDYRAGTDRVLGTTDDRGLHSKETIAADLGAFVPINASEAGTFERLESEGYLGVSSTHFMVRSRGEAAAKKVKLEIVAVFDREGKIYFWEAGIPKRYEPKPETMSI